MNQKIFMKLITGTKFYSLPRMHACMNGDSQASVIDVYGNIYLCEHYVGNPDYSIGKRTEELIASDSRDCNVVFRDKCENCVSL